MADSVKVIDDEFVRRIHSRNVSGRLHKGHGITAATASIPSKYQTIVIDNAEKRGFNSRAKRFQYDSNVDDNPGPGTYMGHATVEQNNPSLSKKGTGGFASKDRRLTKQGMSCSPGAGSYQVPLAILARKDFNRAKTTSVFHQPIAHKVEKTDGVPAPNSYEVLRVKLGPTNNVTASAAFKSKSRRELINTKAQASNPAPWHYQVDDSMLHENVKVPMSSFKSKSKRQMQPDADPVPGPGAYRPGEPQEPVPKLEYPRKHYLCISAPAMPLPPPIPGPGPGSYELVDYDGTPKHYMSSSVFVSNTSRWTGDVRNTAAPGPSHYKPHETGKQSFIYNAQGKWI
ncbi:O(6)-methylguanine-induced apoptosis 2-like [Lineus longissimus]|uniref:O(6)-methylguanine-induced apoptosis 2-like n=1 Tax=Lineus longissimus TaxID=88925 RepID=UPI002B4D137C